MDQSQSIVSHDSNVQVKLFPKMPPSCSMFSFQESDLHQQAFIPSSEGPIVMIKKQEVVENTLILKYLMLKRLLTRFRDNLKTKTYIMSRLFTPQTVHMFEELHSESSITFKDSQFVFSQVFETTNYFLIFWDMCVILFSIFSLWMISFTINFDLCGFRSSDWMFYSVLGFTICDGLVMNNRAIISEGEVIRNRKLIFLSYLHLYLSQEIIYFLTWITYYTSFLENLGGARELILIIQIYLLIGKINQKYSAYYEIIFASGNSGSADLFILVISIYIFNHLMACIWIYVALNSTDLGDTWILNRNLTDPWPIYNTAFYWASMTMTTVGYGDVVPKNDKELIAASAIMFISTCVFAYSMNSIGILLNNINHTKQEYKQNQVHMTTFMKNKDVQQGIQGRVRNYLKFSNNNKSQNLNQISKIISSLPANLKLELNANIKMKAMNQISQIVNNFSLATQTLLSEKLDQTDHISGEIISKSNDYENPSLYYIVKGQVQLRESASNKLIQTLNSGDHFGQYAFYTGFQTQYYAICPTFCSVYKIDRQSFMNVIKHNQHDFQKFHSIKDRLIFNRDFRLVDISCSICSHTWHETIDCPLISYKPDLEARVKSEYFITQDRKPIKRNRTKLHIMAHFKKFTDEGNQFLMSNCESFDDDQQQGSVGKNTSDLMQSHSLNQQQSTINANQLISKEINPQLSSLNVYSTLPKEVIVQRKESILVQVICTTQPKIKSLVMDTHNLFELESMDLQFHYCNIDQLFTYQIYSPNNNIEHVINMMNRKYKQKYYLSNKYSFRSIKKPGLLINDYKQYKSLAIIHRSEIIHKKLHTRKI